MLVFGAIDFAGAVADQASLLGFHVTICDARAVFATEKRFPGADEVVVQWPHRYVASQAEAGRIDRRTAVCVLTHDAKFDIPLIMELVRLPEDQRPFYIGVMGSRRTHDHRLERLREAGATDADIALMHSPIGLDLKGRTPQETALSILSEAIAVRWGGTGAPLSRTSDPIHS
jgi:xanthine dehydrogenase accessory factor